MFLCVIVPIVRSAIVALGSALILFPFFSGSDERRALVAGAAVAGGAGVAASIWFRVHLARGGNLTGALVRAILLRSSACFAGLVACLVLANRFFMPAALALLVAYLAHLAVETASLCRRPEVASPEVKR